MLLNDQVNPSETGGIQAAAVDLNLLDTLNGRVVAGRWLDQATAAFPTVVLGKVAAERLAITDVNAGQQILVGSQPFTVIGVLAEFPLAPDLDRSALIGYPAAQKWLGATLSPGTIQVRTEPAAIDAVGLVLPATADPENPEEVQVSRPSDALEAKAKADSAFTSLFLGLGAVALLVGGIGIANVMVIAVIERRSEIGLRRALGATRAHVRRQFLCEALILSALGGAAGVALGALVTTVYARTQDWRVVLPPEALVGGFVASVLIGAVAGLYPAMPRLAAFAHRSPTVLRAEPVMNAKLPELALLPDNEPGPSSAPAESRHATVIVKARRNWLPAAAIPVVFAAVAAFVVAGRLGSDKAEIARQPPKTAQVTRRDIVVSASWPATLGFASGIDLTFRRDVTAAPAGAGGTSNGAAAGAGPATVGRGTPAATAAPAAAQVGVLRRPPRMCSRRWLRRLPRWPRAVSSTGSTTSPYYCFRAQRCCGAPSPLGSPAPR